MGNKTKHINKFALLFNGFGNQKQRVKKSFGSGIGFGTPQNVVDTAFKMTIDTTLSGSASDTFILPAGNIGTYDAVIDWGDGSTSNITAYNDADLTHIYSVGGIYTIKINGSFPYINFSFGGDKLKAISIDNWGTNQWLSMQQSFGGCENLSIPATDVPDFSLCTSFYRAFNQCYSLGALSKTSQWDMSSATSIRSIFDNCGVSGHLDLSGWDLSSCVSISLGSFPFISNASITSIDVSGWTLRPAGVALSNFINNCDSLTSITGINTWINTSALSSFNSVVLLCSSITSVDFSGMDLSGSSNLSTMLYINASLSSVDLSNITLKNTGTITLNSALYLNNSGGICDIVGLDTWDISVVNNYTSFMSGTKITTLEYDKLLISWDAQDAVDSESVNFGLSQYTLGGTAEAARANLITTDLWTITDGGGI